MSDTPTVCMTTKRQKPWSAGRMRLYVVMIDGYTSEKFIAKSASKARYAAYRALCEAERKWRFKDFLERCHVLPMGVV